MSGAGGAFGGALGWRIGRQARGGFGFALVLLATVLFGGIGMAVIAMNGFGHGTVFGVILIVAVLLRLVVGTLEYRNERNRPGPHFGRAPDGEPATVVERPNWNLPLCGIWLILWASWAAVSAVVFAARQHWVGVVLMVPLVGSFLWPLRALCAGRVSPGGVYLTPEHLQYRKHGGWWRVRWADVSRAGEDVNWDVPYERIRVSVRYGTEIDKGRTCAWPWHGKVGLSTVEKGLLIETRFLASDPATTIALIQHCRIDPTTRERLGQQVPPGFQTG